MVVDSLSIVFVVVVLSFPDVDDNTVIVVDVSLVVDDDGDDVVLLLLLLEEVSLDEEVGFVVET